LCLSTQSAGCLFVDAMATGSHDGLTGPTAAPARHQRNMEHRMGLSSEDDERTAVSKKVSWVLRHGAQKSGVEMNHEGWVLLDQLAGCEILDGVTGSKLLRIIVESNQQKRRYELREEAGGTLAIRAVGKHTIGNMAATTAPKRRGKGGGGRPPQVQKEEELTFEEQLQAGFKPVYRGSEVIAMLRDSVTVRPGRRDGQTGSAPAEPTHPSEEDRQGDNRQRWRVQDDQELIVRATASTDSVALTTICSGAVVVQTGEEVVNQHGIVRLPIEYHGGSIDSDPVSGWVTRTAEAANGPVFLRRLAASEGGSHGSGPSWPFMDVQLS